MLRTISNLTMVTIGTFVASVSYHLALSSHCGRTFTSSTWEYINIRVRNLKKMVQVLNAESIEMNYLRYSSTLRQSMEKGEQMSGANFVTCRFHNRGV